MNDSNARGYDPGHRFRGEPFTTQAILQEVMGQGVYPWAA